MGNVLGNELNGRLISVTGCASCMVDIVRIVIESLTKSMKGTGLCADD